MKSLGKLLKVSGLLMVFILSPMTCAQGPGSGQAGHQIYLSILLLLVGLVVFSCGRIASDLGK